MSTSGLARRPTRFASARTHHHGATTYYEAARELPRRQDRFRELTNRDLQARALATLKARGTYDPDRHGDPGKYPPLIVDEHLEVLALGEAIARFYRHPAYVHHAVTAGASWQQVAAAVDSSEDKVRQDYRDWAAGQRRLYEEYGGKFGIDRDEYAAALARAAEG